jgi:hypothetical protein
LVLLRPLAVSGEHLALLAGSLTEYERRQMKTNETPAFQLDIEFSFRFPRRFNWVQLIINFFSCSAERKYILFCLLSSFAAQKHRPAGAIAACPEIDSCD